MIVDHIVTEESFLGTYKDGLKNRQDYFLARSMRKEGMNYDSIARMLGREDSTVYYWTQGKKEPWCIRGIAEAHALDIIPLTRKSETLRPMIKLCSFVFWTGSVSSDYAVGVAAKPEKLKNIAGYFRKKLGLKGRFSKKPTSAVCFGEQSHLYGRVLACMGAPIGEKVSQELHIPQAILRSPECYHDFVRILFASRSYHHRGMMQITLMANHNRELARDFGNETLDFLANTLPRVKFSSKRLEVLHAKSDDRRKYEHHVPRVSLTTEMTNALNTHYPQIAQAREQVEV